MKSAPPASMRNRRGFTLVELLVSMAILTLLMVVLVSITDATGKTWAYTSGKSEEFRDAREAFESITRRLSQATLNTYLDYEYKNGTTAAPTAYVRQSELRYINSDAKTLTGAANEPTHALFFQAPLGYVSDQANYANMDSLLNTWGYFIQYASDKAAWPNFIAGMAHPPAERYRFRVMEMSEPSEQLTLYQYSSGLTDSSNPASAPRNPGYFTHPALPGLTLPSGTAQNNTTGWEWFNAPLTATSPPVRVLAENIVALVVLPKLATDQEQSLVTAGTLSGPLGTNLAPNYSYDSTAIHSVADINPRNQLPPIVQVTMVAVDESSFSRLQPGAAMPAFTAGLFATTAANNASHYQDDLNQLQANLLGKSYSGGGNTDTPSFAHPPLNYRVFTTNVSIKSARWSRDQTN